MPPPCCTLVSVIAQSPERSGTADEAGATVCAPSGAEKTTAAISPMKNDLCAMARLTSIRELVSRGEAVQVAVAAGGNQLRLAAAAAGVRGVPRSVGVADLVVVPELHVAAP